MGMFRNFWEDVKGDAKWDAVKKIWSDWVPYPWREVAAGMISGFFQWLISAPWLTIFGVAAFGMFLVNQIDIRRERRQNRQLLPTPKPEEVVVKGDLSIDYAGYGLGPGQYRNRTDRVRSLIKDDRLRLEVGPVDLQCEVYGGKPGRHLLVIYSYRETEGICHKVDVGQKVALP